MATAFAFNGVAVNVPRSGIALAPSSGGTSAIRRFMSAEPAEKTEEEKAAIKAAREARKAEKERKMLEKKAKKEAEKAAAEAANRIDDVQYLSYDQQDGYASMGDMVRTMSRSRTGRDFVDITDLGASEDATYKPGSTVWARGRLHSIRVKGGSCFPVLRQDSFNTVQACFFKDKEDPEGSAKMIRYLKSLTVESIVDLEGVVAEASVKSCSVQDVELNIKRIHAVSKADAMLPFLVEDAARSEEEVEASQDTDRPFPRLGQELRLDNRWMDLRAPANNAIMRIQSAICQLYRESLYSQGFVEIHTPKLIAGESESGAGVFTTDYFGTVACLAQSPQLYKQMAISSDLERVFEIGPVFRAESRIPGATFASLRVLTSKWPSRTITWRHWRSFMRCSNTSSPVSRRGMPKSSQSFVSSTPRLLLPSLRSHALFIGPRPWRFSREKDSIWATKWVTLPAPWNWLLGRQSKRNMELISSCWTSIRPKFDHFTPCPIPTMIDSPTRTIYSSVDRRFARELSVVMIPIW